MVGDWALSGRDIDRMRLRWQDFLCVKFPCSTRDCLDELYAELIEWDGEVAECIRLLLEGRRVNLAKLRDDASEGDVEVTGRDALIFRPLRQARRP